MCRQPGQGGMEGVSKAEIRVSRQVGSVYTCFAEFPFSCTYQENVNFNEVRRRRGSKMKRRRRQGNRTMQVCD